MSALYKYSHKSLLRVSFSPAYPLGMMKDMSTDRTEEINKAL